MKSYIAAPWDCKDIAKEIRDHLKKLKVESTASWIDLSGDYFAGPPASEAARDVSQIRDADMFVMYVPDPDTSRGGRDVEFGMALMANYPIILIGTRRCVFHWHPDVRYFSSVAEFKEGSIDGI